MQLRLLKRAIVQIITGVVFLVLLFIGYIALATHLGERRAIAACAEMPVGMSFADAHAYAGKVVDKRRLLLVSDDFIAVGFEGAIMDRWFCNSKFVDGRLVEHEIRLLD